MYTNLQGCRQVVLAGLKEIGAAFVSVSFEGCGDSGECDDVTIIDANNNSLCDAAKAINVVYIRTTEVRWKPGTAPQQEEVRKTLLDAVEDVAYMEVMNTGVDWYNNEGGSAEWAINVQKGTQQLTVDVNVIETKTEHDTGEQRIKDWINS